MRRAREAFEDIEFHPDILKPAQHVDTSTEVLGGLSALPFGIAPTGFTRLMQTEGEVAGAGAAGAAGIPFTLSTLGTTSIEGVQAANPDGRNWFQLYVMRTREVSYELTKRAAAAGFDTLTSTGGTVGALLDSAMDPTISTGDLSVIRELWPGKIAIKGVQTVEDARTLAGLGVDGIVLSNHGGRQLDRAPVPFYLLPDVVREVGKDTEIVVDTGIMHGADIVASIALGARFTLVGRAYLYGLMAGGRPGVDRAIAILRDQIARTMKLLQVATIAELEPGHVTQLQRLIPIRR